MFVAIYGISVVVMAPTSLPLHPPSSGCHGDPYTLRPDGLISRYLSLGIRAGNGVFVQLTLDTMAQLFHDRALHRDRDEPSLSEHCDNPLCASITDLGTCVQSIIVLNGGIGHVALRCHVQPGKSFGPNKMDTPMVCHMLEGEMEITQSTGTFMAKKNHVWTCKTGITEGGTNKGTGVAVMRVTFLLPT